MSEYYYLVAAIAYGIFICQFILSWFGGDTDLDVDLDGDPDMDVSDIVSFKGLIHFLMGSSGWLCVKQWTSGEIFWWDYLIALACGVFFVIVLYYLYKLLMKLEHKPEILRGKELIGKNATVYLKLTGSDGTHGYIILISDNNGTVELPAVSDHLYSAGTIVSVKDFKEPNYII